MDIKVSASILSADLTSLGTELLRAERGGADYIHFDVMDGLFVPNFTYGNVVLNQLDKVTGVPFDTHLMVSDPTALIPRFKDAGSDIITIHIESNGSTTQNLAQIRSLGIKAGLSIKPATPAEAVFPYLDKCDMVLVMTVEPGEGGQSFIYETVPKIEKIRAEITRRGLSTDLEVDGGININTAPLVRRAGANVLVSGSYLFASADFSSAVETIRFIL